MGQTLLVVLLVLLVIMMLGGALVTMSGKTMSSAKQRETTVELANCAQAVRSYVGSQVKSGAGLSQMTFTIAGTNAPIKLEGGHYENINISNFSWNPPSFGSKPSNTVENLANALPLGLGGSNPPTVGTAVCTDTNGHQYEIEFAFVGG